MKGIIVVDIPESCLECKVSEKIWRGNELFVDCLYLEYTVKNPSKRDKNCPIKKMPEKMKVSRGMMNRLKDQIRGYNHCIDKILKGAENGQEQTTDR